MDRDRWARFCLSHDGVAAIDNDLVTGRNTPRFGYIRLPSIDRLKIGTRLRSMTAAQFG